MLLGFSAPFVATVVAAATCTVNGHTSTLSNGDVSPNSGSPTTNFTFSVTFTDNQRRPVPRSA